MIARFVSRARRGGEQNALAPDRAASAVAFVACAAVAALVASGSAAAAIAGARPVLKGTPFQHFTDEDTRQFVDAARAAADSTEAADEARWANEASGAWGTMTVKRAFKRNGAPCRELRGEATARGRTEPFRVVLCKNKGEWKVTSSGPARN